jgi:hypothetical protein
MNRVFDTVSGQRMQALCKVLQKPPFLGRINEILRRTERPAFGGEGVRPNWLSAAHVLALSASRPISSDFFV